MSDGREMVSRMSLSPSQLAQRLEGITATDVAAIAGVHPYRSPLDCWMEKIGEAQPFEGNDRSRWGDLLEGPIREDYEERHGVRVEVPGTLTHPDHPTHMATPDGIVYAIGSTRAHRGLEIKVHGRDAVRYGGLEYGPPGTDEVPAHELVQCAWNMHVSGLDRWDLVAFLDGAPVEYAIDRDDDLIGVLVEQADRFLVDYVRANTPPPPDGSTAWDEWLKRRWSSNGAELLAIDGDEPTLELVARLRDARGAAADLEIDTDRIVQTLKAMIGERAGLTWREPGQKSPAKLTWKRSKDGSTDDHKATIAAMRSRATIALSEAISDMTPEQMLASTRDALTAIAAMAPIRKTTTGARPFVCPRFWKTTKPTKETADE